MASKEKNSLVDEFNQLDLTPFGHLKTITQDEIDSYTAQIDEHLKTLVTKESKAALPPPNENEKLATRAARWALLASNLDIALIVNHRIREPTEDFFMSSISKPGQPDKVMLSVTMRRDANGYFHLDYTYSKTCYMAKKAMIIARQIFGNDESIRCFFATVSQTKKPWFCAVARCLRKLEKIEKNHVSSCRVLRDLVGHFSALNEDFLVNNSDLENHRTLTDAPAHSPAANLFEQTARSFASSEVAAMLKEQGCCSICALERLIKIRVPKYYYDVIKRLPRAKILLEDACIHNREMHFINYFA